MLDNGDDRRGARRERFAEALQALLREPGVAQLAGQAADESADGHGNNQRWAGEQPDRGTRHAADRRALLPAEVHGLADADLAVVAFAEDRSALDVDQLLFIGGFQPIERHARAVLILKGRHDESNRNTIRHLLSSPDARSRARGAAQRYLAGVGRSPTCPAGPMRQAPARMSLDGLSLATHRIPECQEVATLEGEPMIGTEAPVLDKDVDLLIHRVQLHDREILAAFFEDAHIMTRKRAVAVSREQ